MRQDSRRWRVAGFVALALLLAATTSAWGAAPTGEDVRRAIVLRMSIDGQMFEVTALFGEVFSLRTEAGAVFHLVPKLGPAVGDRDPSVSVEVYELIGNEGSELANLKEIVSLPSLGEGSATATTLDRTIQIEPVALRDVRVPEPLAGGDASLRRVECCITCQGAEFCAFCVQASCGVCCVS